MGLRRVLICGFTEGQGGMESYIMEIYRHCDRSKLQFDFLNFHTFEISYAEEIRKLGGNIYYVPMKSVDMKGHYQALEEVFSNHDYAGVYYQCNNKLVSLDVFVYAKKHNVPKRVIHSHNSTQKKNAFLHRVREKLTELRMDRYVTHYFACSNEAGMWMFGKRRFRVIKNSVDTDIFFYNEAAREKIRKTYGLGEKIVVGTVGRFVEAKNPKFMLEIFDELQKKNKETVFLHVGNGSLMDEMVQKRDTYEWKDKYIFVGNQNNVADYMNAMDVFILPSLHEGFPIVLVEAQATGLQCIVADNITKTCKLTRNMTFLPIQGSAALWADKIMESALKERKSEAVKIRLQGYDIVEVSKQMERFFGEDRYA
uniref:glycosyltransferase n=1 Tax=Agathobacter sp. TaxID=2021311 RepID=UPI004055B57A